MRPSHRYSLVPSLKQNKCEPKRKGMLKPFAAAMRAPTPVPAKPKGAGAAGSAGAAGAGGGWPAYSTGADGPQLVLKAPQLNASEPTAAFRREFRAPRAAGCDFWQNVVGDF